MTLRRTASTRRRTCGAGCRVTCTRRTERFRSGAQRPPRPRADDAVRLQVTYMLEVHDRGSRVRPEQSIGMDPQPALQPAYRGTACADAQDGGAVRRQRGADGPCMCDGTRMRDRLGMRDRQDACVSLSRSDAVLEHAPRVRPEDAVRREVMPDLVTL